VGIALAERDTGRARPVIAIIGDGSFQYSLQSIWNAVQLHLPMLIVILRNEEYAILKSFAVLELTPGVPGLDIPGLDFVSIAKGYGCDAARLDDLDAIKQAAATAWTKDVPTVLEIPISPQVPPLI
jgi:benzoylformate decarboxylase